MSLLATPAPSATTALLLTENWLQTVFPSDLYTVCLRPGEGPTRPPAVAVSRRAPGAEPLLAVAVTAGPLSAEAEEELGRFAAAGVPDVWVLEVAARRLLTFRGPRPDGGARHGYSYSDRRAHSQYSLVAPLAAEIHLAQVVNLLPW